MKEFRIIKYSFMSSNRKYVRSICSDKRNKREWRVLGKEMWFSTDKTIPLVIKRTL